MDAADYWGSDTGQEIRDMDSHSLRFDAERYRETHQVKCAQRECFACGTYRETVPIVEAHNGTKLVDWKCPKCGAKNGQS